MNNKLRKKAAQTKRTKMKEQLTVKELIELLQTYPQDILVARELFSEKVLVEEGNFCIEEHCPPRNDGWVHEKRPDRPTQKYLVIAGN